MLSRYEFNHGIIGGLFRILIDSAEILGISDDCVEKIKAAKAKLPPFRVGKFGQLMEWIEDNHYRC